MTFVSIKQSIAASVPLHYTKKTEKDITHALKNKFSFLNSVSLDVTFHHIVLSPASSLESQQILWYRQEIITFLATQGLSKQIKIIYAPERRTNIGTC